MGNNQAASAADLLLFAEVVEAGSFTAAADRLGLPKSSVSRRIAALEARLGERLLTRSTRRLALTDFGSALQAHARRVAEEVEAVQALAEHRRSEPSGLLRVSMPGDFAMLTLPQMLTDFTRRHPRIVLQLDLSPRRVDLLAENFDLAIRMGVLPDDATLVARRLAEFEFGLVAAPAYLAVAGMPRHPESLPAHRCIAVLTRDGRSMPWHLQREAEHWSGALAEPIAANSMGVLVQLARAGAGIAAVSLHYVEEALEQGELVRLLPDWRMPSNPAWAVMPSRRLVPPKTRAFIDALKGELARWAGPGRPVAPGPAG
ncbi:MAG: LysR family transcriptional regulator [Rhodocyclaceae bacterium]|nr:LysR family transcriptional regulator [Rhodocyclaceae bacterium]